MSKLHKLDSKREEKLGIMLSILIPGEIEERIKIRVLWDGIWEVGSLGRQIHLLGAFFSFFTPHSSSSSYTISLSSTCYLSLYLVLWFIGS